MDNKQHLKIPLLLNKADKHHETDCSPVLVTSWPINADSHIACRAHAAPIPCSFSAVSFVNVRVVAGNIRSASRTV